MSICYFVDELDNFGTTQLPIAFTRIELAVYVQKFPEKNNSYFTR